MPALHRGMMRMTQLPRQSANASEADNEGSVFHVHSDVHSMCTNVNVDCVRALPDIARMNRANTTGQILRDLMDRAGFTIRGFAQAAGYASGSGVQRYIEAEFDEALSPKTARKLADALVGKGIPPIEEREVFSLIGLPEGNAVVIPMEGASLQRPQENLQVWGAALGAEREFDGQAVELTTLNTGGIVDYVRRPAMLNGKKGVYALHVQGSSMHPALPDGEMIVAAREMPLSVGDNVVVYLRTDEPDFDDGETSRGVLVKELVRRSASYVELRQYQPQRDFRVDMRDVLRIDRVLTRREMLS